MGLDMYLYHDSSFYGFSEPGKAVIPKVGRLLRYAGINPTAMLKQPFPIVHIKVCVAYWRKANAIHGWFVRNCQQGEDECQETYVEREKLQELLALAKAALDPGNPDHKDALEALVPVGGFSFGGTDRDEYYTQDLKDTVDQLKQALLIQTGDFYYRSSW